MNLEPASSDEINLLDLLIVLAKHKKMILSVTFAAAARVIGILLLLPNIYTTTGKSLLQQSNQSSSANSLMLAQLGGLAGGKGGALGLKVPNSLYLAMMKSRTNLERIVQHFDLRTVYETTMAGTLKDLEKQSNVAVSNDGVFTMVFLG